MLLHIINQSKFQSVGSKTVKAMLKHINSEVGWQSFKIKMIPRVKTRFKLQKRNSGKMGRSKITEWDYKLECNYGLTPNCFNSQEQMT